MRAPFAAPRGSPAALLAVARCRSGQVSLSAHPPIVGSGPSLCCQQSALLLITPCPLPHQRSASWRGRARPGPRDGVCTHKSENHTRGPQHFLAEKMLGWVLGSALPVSADFWRKRREKSRLSRKYTSCWGENCRKNRKKNSGLGFVKEVCFLLGRTGAKCAGPTPGKGNGKGRRLVQKSNVKREGSRCNQAPGSTLVRKEIRGVARAFALARIVPGKLPGSSAHLVC